MSNESQLPAGRFQRFARLAAMSVRTGAGMLMDKQSGGAAHAAEVLGNLRGIAAKVGQMASYVDGMVPEAQQPAYEAALRTLQAQAPRSSAQAIRARVEEELRAPIDKLFVEWNDTPIASASIGQVHSARLLDGQEVAVKVQHPGIDRAIESDLANAGVLESMVGALAGKRLNSKAVFQTVRDRFREELDYRLEAQRLCAFAAVHQGDPKIRIPRWFESHSSTRVLTCQLMRGLSFEAACESSEAARRGWAETMWRFVFKCSLTAGLLAVDPHPGNYMFQEDGRVVFLDYGCVQLLDDRRRAHALAVHRAALHRDENAFATAVKTMVESRPGRLEPVAVDYTRLCFAPLFHSPYRLTRAYASQLMVDMKELGRLSLTVPAAETFPMPADMLFVNRLQFGFYSVLARLDVEVDYGAVESAFLAGHPG